MSSVSTSQQEFQALFMARERADLQVQLSVPGVATSFQISMTKGLQTGGRADPNVFVYMFERLLHDLEGEWELLGLGFTLQQSGVRISHVAWVDNLLK